MTCLLSGLCKGKEQHLPLSLLVFLQQAHAKDIIGHTHTGELSMWTISVGANWVSVVLELHLHSTVPVVWIYQLRDSVLQYVLKKPIQLAGDGLAKAKVGLSPASSPRNQRSPQRRLVPAEGDLSLYCSI